MDEKTVNFDQGRYEEIKSEIETYFKRVGYNAQKIPFIPLSGWLGDNLIERSTNTNWYNGPTLLEALDSIIPS